MRSARASQLGPGRLAAVAAVVALLASLVAVASGGRTVSGERGGGLSPVVADLLVIVISTTGVALFVLLAPQALTLARDERRAREAQGRKKAPLVLVAILVVASLALLATAMPEIVDRLRERGLLPGSNGVPGGGTDGTAPPEEGATGGQMLTTLLLTLAAIAAVVAWTRRGKTTMRERSLREDMVEAIDEGVDDLRGDADPRRATIEAYARMERVCAYHGLPRQPSEAPGEFLSRTLVPLGAGADGARRLTGLFELAGFSAHAVGEPERAQAIDALCSVRDALQEAGA